MITANSVFVFVATKKMDRERERAVGKVVSLLRAKKSASNESP